MDAWGCSGGTMGMHVGAIQLMRLGHLHGMAGTVHVSRGHLQGASRGSGGHMMRETHGVRVIGAGQGHRLIWHGGGLLGASAMAALEASEQC